MRARRRPAVWTAPWLRGPLLLVGQPMTVVAVVAATAVLGLVVAAGPLFASSVGTAALHAAAAKECVQNDQVAVVNSHAYPVWAGFLQSQTPAAVAAADPVVRAAFARQGLPAPVRTSYSAVPTGTGSPAQPDQLGLFTTPGALDHVRVLSRVPGDGVFVTDTYAAAHGMRPGSELFLPSGRLRIAGIYADLDTASYRTVLPAFWCHWRDLIVTSVSSAPPPFVLADPATIAAHGTEVAAEWTSPVDVDSLTVAQATVVAAAGRRLLTPAQTREESPGSVLAGYAERTDLDFNLSQTAKLQAAVATPVLAIAAAGAVLSLLLVAGAVLFWIQRRRAELTLLAARGIGPAALGVKAVAELALPAAVGCAAGWAAGVGLVPVLGPSALTEPGAPARAAVAAAGAWAGGLAVVWLVAAVTLGEHRMRGRAALRFVPAGAVAALVGAAVWLFHRADLNHLVLPGVYRIDPALLLAPVLGLTGGVLAAALLAVAPLRRARAAARRARFPVFAAVNRAAAARGPAVAVICGLAIPVGLAVYAAGFTASAAATVTAKAQVYTGAPVAFDLRVLVGHIPNLGTAATPVSYALGTATTTVPGDAAGSASDAGTEVELLGVDPATFAAYAYADPEFTGAPLPDLLHRLTGRTADGPSPALLVGDWTGPAPATVQVRSSTLPVTVVDRAPAFPGIRYPYHPAIVVNLAAVAGMDSFGGWVNGLWSDQDHAASVLAALGRRGILTDDVQQPASFLDASSLLPVTWTFDFLRAVSILVAAVSAAGLLLFLSARQQRQQTAYIMMRRMGMTRRAHLRSLLLELGALTGWAWATGAATGLLALTIATGSIDVDPGFLPPTLLRRPTTTVLATAAGLLAIAAVLAGWTQHRADRAHPATVLRA